MNNDNHAPHQNERPYHEEDHGHCWERKKPPCGQKIEHLKCCLCEMLNHKVVSRTQIAEVVEGMKLADGNYNSVEKYANDSVNEALEALKAKLINPNKHD